MKKEKKGKDISTHQNVYFQVQLFKWKFSRTSDTLGQFKN